MPSEADLPNPERGLMRQRQLWPDHVEPVSASHDPNTTLLWFYIRLDAYRTRPLDEVGLGRIQDALDRVRDAGLKVVLRFTYNFERGGEDASLEQVLEHIRQVEPLLVANSDIIAAIQAGFVGSWGEWQRSPSGLTSLESKQAIIQALVEAVPSRVMLQLRYPADKMALFGGPLTEEQAFGGSPAARIGHHNDCFLADESDLGTYRPLPAEPWKAFVAQEGRFTPVGGETCRDNPPRTLCPTALAELERLHWTFMNAGYQPEVIERWKADGCWDTIRRRLGYRLTLTGASVVEEIRPGGLLDLDVRLLNRGFASMYNRRPVFVVLQGDSATYGMELPDVDLRRLEPSETLSISVRARLPATVPEGAYRLALWLPDANEALRSRPSYSVRFANRGVWDATAGYNVLTNDVLVDVGAPSRSDPSAPELAEF